MSLRCPRVASFALAAVALSAVTLLAAALPGSRAFAGEYVEASRTDLLAPLEAPQTQKLWFDSERLRLEDERADSVEIFRDGLLFLLQPQRNRYTALEVKDLDPPVREVRRTTRTESAAGFPCTVWEIRVAGEKVRELCVADPGGLPGGEELVSTLRSVSAVAAQLARSPDRAVRESVLGAWSDLGAVNGVPLISRTFAGGQPATEVRLTALRRESVPFTAFDLPTGARRVAVAAGRGI